MMHWQWLFGHVIRAVGERCCLVCFDDCQEKECSSNNIIKVDSVSPNLSLNNILLPVFEVSWNISAAEKAVGDPDVIDNEGFEDTPSIKNEIRCRGSQRQTEFL